MFRQEITIGGAILISFHGLDESGEMYQHPYFKDEYVWSCEEYEISDIFSECDDETNLYPREEDIIRMLDSGSILSDLGLSYCTVETI